MSETATIASSDSGGRPALDLSETLPIARSPNLHLIGSSSSPETTHECLLLRDKFIYTTSSASSPSPSAAYHLSTRRTRSGLPWTLSISRLLPSEVRLLAASSPSPSVHIKYDDDLTLYTGERIAVPFCLGPTPLLCIRGRSLPAGASIVVDAAHKFWRVTPRRRPLTAAEEERMRALMHRRGYRAGDDWRRELLYAVGKGAGEWTDKEGVVVAREGEDGQLVVAGRMEAGERDLLVACWAARNFVRSAAEAVA
ncbi:hypothetical protein ISF_06165 [Cordyceps fumosorosea ARSEF 2679]|uniref:Uncharacterized protein n=1 Tax=Cordyceps fumosorosea (strain ARSEF 2679) TaxID=1081104 RepID=A0A167T1L0_CORFA|nr:hypothetical protein ISF_06165 [Cordyceps fumosorosea ARSEF 2679]OAA60155.1 hypothetical protein ISF_06165 [Cordyceps fumosorosea ARSEF 2679]